MQGFAILSRAGLVCGAVAFAVLNGTSDAQAASHGDGFTIVSDLEAFEASFVGPRITDMEDDANYFVIMPDGTIEGTWYGKEMAGAWRWEDGYFCRTLSAPRPAPEDCQEWAMGQEKVRLVRDRGTGGETIYAIRD